MKSITRRNWASSIRRHSLSLTARILLLSSVAGCTNERDAAIRDRSADSGYTKVQERGAAVMGVDQYTSQHVFEDLADGGRIVLDRDDSRDSAGITQIRRHMRAVASDFTSGNFTKPFAVHSMSVPGTDVMKDRSAAIRYAVVDRPRGAEVRIFSRDQLVIDAVHRFLAFQRAEHHAAESESPVPKH